MPKKRARLCTFYCFRLKREDTKAATLAQEDASGNLQIFVLEKIHGVVQRLVVAGQGVFMELLHQQLIGLIDCTWKEEECIVGSQGTVSGQTERKVLLSETERVTLTQS